ncbi:MAG: metal-sulfur cluster assembly factor [Terriglobales bacterium]
MITEDEIWAALRECYDPELPVDVVNLGLIQSVAIAEDGRVTVEMTLTTQRCPAAVSLPSDLKQRLLRLPGVIDAEIKIVWTPPWTPHRISPEGRKKLGLDEN